MPIATSCSMVSALARGVLMVLLAVACGGHTEGGTGEPGAPADGKDRNDGDREQGSSGSKVAGDTPLGECTLGFPPHRPEGRSCTWLADALCYESRDMACNCICPRDRDSQCSSEFEDGPDGRVEVYCR